MKKLAALFALALSMTACVSNGDAVFVYVLTPRLKAVQFTDDLGKIANRYGLTPNPGRSTDDRGLTYYVMEATGHWLRLWSTNMPLSGQENPDLCGHYSEGHPDPGQYALSVSPLWPFASKGDAQSMIMKISKALKSSGYEVRQTPVECSPLSNRDKVP